MESLYDLFLNSVKEKNQYKKLDSHFILKRINSFFLTNGDIRKKLQKEFEKKREKIVKASLFKQALKAIKEELGVVYGSFLTQDSKKKLKLLEQITTKEDCLKLLTIHKSSRERVEDYKEIYSNIFSWYKPKKIADLACGYNPLSYSLLPKSVSYFAADLNAEDSFFLNAFFRKFKIEGIAKVYDLLSSDLLKEKELLSSDIIFLFKALDSLEYIKKNSSKKLLKSLLQKHIVVSFALKSLTSQKEFKEERRNWFFNFLKKEEWMYETFKTENELFILITKK